MPSLSLSLDDEENTINTTYDVKYHLLKLYCDRSHALEHILTTATHTPDYLDHRLSWFLGESLRSLGYLHMSPDKRDALHLSFSAQLEALGLWHWAIYVLLHLSDRRHRRSQVIRVCGLHIRINNDEESGAEKEAFLSEQLGVPFSWIAEAKAVRAGFEYVCIGGGGGGVGSSGGGR